jgi:hypothetical protein
VALGNALKEQLKDETSAYVMDAKSISYDVSDDIWRKYESYENYLTTLRESGAEESQTISAGSDTINALLLTLRIPNDSSKETIDLIHSSGVHGIEGYLGSAIQLRFLHEVLIQNEHQSSSKATSEYKLRKVLIIHSINPFGMRHHRRTNENNVDLNRNVLSEEEWEWVRKRDPNFAGYVELDSVLNPFIMQNDEEIFLWEDAARMAGYGGDVDKLKQRDNEVRFASVQHLPKSYIIPALNETNTINNWMHQTLEILQSIPRLVKAMSFVGYTQTKRAFVSSQYLKQSGSQYGGGNHRFHVEKWENSVLAVHNVINEFSGFDLRTGGSKVFWIDVHTGLGKYGEFAMLSAGSKSPDVRSNISEPKWAQKLTTQLGNSLLFKESSSQDVSEGYDLTRGFVNGQILCPIPNCFAKTQEFGTRPGIFVGMSMVLENKSYNTGRRDFAFATSWAFNPRRLSWRQKTLRGGIELLHAVMDF